MNILPIPKKTQKHDGHFSIKTMPGIYMNDWTHPFTAMYLKKSLEILGIDSCITSVLVNNSIILNFDDNMLSEQAYRLEIKKDTVRIDAGSHSGLFYGACTLIQIIREYGLSLPCCVIEDEPDIACRGILFDTTRGRVPTIETLKKLVDLMAFYKLNHLQLYVEHSFVYNNMTEAWRGASPLTPEDILSLKVYAKERFVELVPSFASFGHLYQILSTKSYERFAELDRLKNDYSWIDRQIHHTVNVSDENAVQMLHDMIDETLPLFDSEYFNLGCDETFDLCRGKSKEYGEKVGITGAYIKFVSELCEYVRSKGKKPMIFCDILMHVDKEQLAQEFSDTTLLSWSYRSEGRDELVEKVSQSGCPQFVCGGTSGWNRYINDYETAKKNITSICKSAKKHGALGVINTDWGDMGHINNYEVSVPMYLYGASRCWNSACDITDGVIEQCMFGKKNGLISLIEQLHEAELFNWADISCWNEQKENHHFEKEDIIQVWINDDFMSQRDYNDIKKAYDFSLQAVEELRSMVVCADGEHKKKLKIFVNQAQGVVLSNALLYIIKSVDFEGCLKYIVPPMQLAQQFELWGYEYEKIWRADNKESELRRILRLIWFVCDYLRDISKENNK